MAETTIHRRNAASRGRTKAGRFTSQITARYDAGVRFGALTVIRDAPTSGPRRALECRCDCGAIKVIMYSNLARQKSCGCLRGTHGLAKTPEYTAWVNMNRRCHYPPDPSYWRYGGRGIIVCDEWRHNFAAFYSEIGPRPSALHSLDRIDNNRGYESRNVRWATDAEQKRNMRKNVWLTHEGRTMVLRDWATETGLKQMTIRSRLRVGMSAGEALSRKGRRPPAPPR